MITCIVTSSGTSVTGQPAASTASAACGSPWILASATFVMLPEWPLPPNAPPMTTTRAILSAMPGSASSASARFVSLPTAMIVTSPG